MSFVMFYLVDEDREGPITTKTFRWRADEGPTLSAGLEALLFFR